MPGWILGVVKNLCLPGQPTGSCIEGEDVVGIASVDDKLTVYRDIPIDADQASEVVTDVVRNWPTVLPEKVAGDRIDCLDRVVRVRHIHHTVVDKGSALLAACI